MKRKVAMVIKKTKKALSQEEQFWNEVDQQAHYLIADVLAQILPLPNLRKKENLNLDSDADYNEILFEYENNYSEEDNFEDLSAESLAEEIAYEYLVLVVRVLVRNLSKFAPYSPDHFEDLIE